MIETPHSEILDRETATLQVNEHLRSQIDLLRDLANYGSNLVIRSYNSSPKEIEDVVACGVLLKQVVAMVDATEVLVSAGAVHSAFLPARTAFEASIYLDWVLFSNSKRKATAYLVRNLRDERVWIGRVTPGTTEYTAFDTVAKSIGLDILASRPTLAGDASQHLSEVDRILAQPGLAEMDQEFTNLRKKTKRDPDWYEVEGVTSVRQIAKAVGRLAEYEAFYTKGSQITHTGSYKDQILFKGGAARLRSIRNLESINLLLQFIVSIAIASYKSVLGKYRPGELVAFRKKYIEDWRDPFMSAPKIAHKNSGTSSGKSASAAS